MGEPENPNTLILSDEVKNSIKELGYQPFSTRYGWTIKTGYGDIAARSIDTLKLAIARTDCLILLRCVQNLLNQSRIESQIVNCC